MKQWDSEAGLGVISIPEEIHKYHTCDRRTNPISLPFHSVLFLSLEQGPACRIPLWSWWQEGSWAGTTQSWKPPHPWESLPIPFPPAVSQVKTLLEVQEAHQVQLKHTEMNLKNLNFRMISTQEHQQPGLFTNHFIFLNRKKEESV